jgi:hypothetical protein
MKVWFKVPKFVLSWDCTRSVGPLTKGLTWLDWATDHDRKSCFQNVPTVSSYMILLMKIMDSGSFSHSSVHQEIPPLGQPRLFRKAPLGCVPKMGIPKKCSIFAFPPARSAGQARRRVGGGATCSSSRNTSCCLWLMSSILQENMMSLLSPLGYNDHLVFVQLFVPFSHFAVDKNEPHHTTKPKFSHQWPKEIDANIEYGDVFPTSTAHHRVQNFS